MHFADCPFRLVSDRKIYDSVSIFTSKISSKIKIGMSNKKTDVLIIGGGPAGTTFGSLMRKRGYDVTLLEKDHHPRFHIGESLLPMNIPILERLGVLDQVKSMGVKKLGADFTVGNSGAEPVTFYFREALGDSPDSAFEVRRAEFDHILFGNCTASGVHTFEGMKVHRVDAIENGVQKVYATDENGEEHVWAARFLVDASGRDTFLSSSNGWKLPNRRHASAAVFGHFRGVERRPGEDQGNISIYWFESGWIWMIPLQDDIMSVGAVCYPEYLRTRKGSLDEFLQCTLAALAETKQRMAGATAVMPARATGNYSYLSKRMSGPGYLMVGDAFAFIDPVFSSGVYLAMHAAERAVPVAEAWLSGNRIRHQLASRRYQREIQTGIANFSWFIYRFTTPVMRNLMSNPRNVLKVVQAVISMLAGDVFRNRDVRRRLLVFKTIYAVSSMFNWKEASVYRKARMARVRAAVGQ
jgi:flavin-dependent dehydrogenase